MASLRTRMPAVLPVALALAVAVVEGVLAGVDPRLGIAFALGVGFVLVVLADLVVGLSAMVLLSCLESLTDGSAYSPAKLAGIVLVGAWLASVTSSGTRQRNLLSERSGLTYVVVLFLAWACVSYAWSEVPGEVRTSVMRYVLNFALVPIVYTAFRTERDATWVLGTLVGAGAVAAASAIATGSTATSADFTRATGTVGDANELAAALIVSGALGLAFALDRRRDATVRVLAAGSALLCVVGILLTLSRGGLLGLLAAGVVGVFVAGRRRGRAATGVVVLALMAVGYFALFASTSARERVTTAGGGTGRVDLWTIGLRMLEDHPIRGVGTGQFQATSVEYLIRPGTFQRADYVLVHPLVTHNTYLNVAAELGLVGGGLFLAWIAVSVWSAVRAIGAFERRGASSLGLLTRGLVAGLAGWLVACIFLSENYSKLFYLLMAFGPALLALARDPLPPSRTPD